MHSRGRTSLRRALGLVAVLLALGGAAWIGLRLGFRDPGGMPTGGELMPAGRWHVDRTASDPDRARELARLVSLGYAEGTVAAGERPTGVVVHDRERAEPGVNFYVSGHAPEALLVDMDGRVLHRWARSYEDVFGPPPRGVESPYFRRALLLPDGQVLAIFQGGGMLRLDRDSRVLWQYEDAFFNDFFLAPDGTVYALTKRARPARRGQRVVLEDSILVLPPGGEPRRISLLEPLLAATPPILDASVLEGDVLHSNTIEVFDGSLAAASPLFAAGRALVSFREANLLAIVDLASGDLVWSLRGAWRGQHQPTPLPNGNLVLFDNLGAGGAGSRVIEIEPRSGAIVWEYDGPPGRPLGSPQAGSVQRLAGGNTLVTESEQGRALEVTHEGDIVWEFVSPHRAGEADALVATLFELVRYPLEHARWLGG